MIRSRPAGPGIVRSSSVRRRQRVRVSRHYGPADSGRSRRDGLGPSDGQLSPVLQGTVTGDVPHPGQRHSWKRATSNLRNRAPGTVHARNNLQNNIILSLCHYVTLFGVTYIFRTESKRFPSKNSLSCPGICPGIAASGSHPPAPFRLMKSRKELVCMFYESLLL